MSSNEGNSEQEKDIVDGTVSGSMELDEEEGNEGEGNYSTNNNNGSSHINANNKNAVVNKKRAKKNSKSTKKSKHCSKRSKYINKNQKELAGNELAASLAKQAKEHYLYKPFYSLPDLTPYIGEIIEVRVASEFLSSLNKAYVENRIWGSDIYTSDSDMVCVLQHSGIYNINDYTPTEIEGLSIYLRVSKGRAAYNSSLKNGVRSKKLNNYQGHSIKIEGYTGLSYLGDDDELKSMAAKMPSNSEYERKKPNPQRLADNMYYTEFNMVFNLSFEMWLSYSLPAICDKGRNFKDFTSHRLQKNVLYIETSTQRFEISLNIMDHSNDEFLFEEYEKFNVAEVKEPIPKDNDFMLENKIPLEEKYVIPIFSRIDWHEFLWGENCLKIKDKIISGIKCFNYYQRCNEVSDKMSVEKK